VLFKREFHAGLVDGSITLTFRRWSRPQVKPGGRYRHAFGLLDVESLDRVRVRDIRAADAGRSGFESRDALLAALARSGSGPLRPTERVFRIALRYAGPAPSRSDEDARVPAEELDALLVRLDRMDERSATGPWTRRVLKRIGEQPRTAASKLAPALGRETQPFKADVRKLKRLGLTVSFEVGYALSPRGKQVLARTGRRPK